MTTLADPRVVVPTSRPRPAAVHRTTSCARDFVVPGGPAGETWFRLFRPPGNGRPLPVVGYVHNGSRDRATERRALRLAADVHAAVVVVDYSLAPTARVPVALEEDYAALAWLAAHGAEYGLDGARIALSADPEAADRADDLMLLADRRGELSLSAHVLWTPAAAPVLRAALAA
ncbi:alpha/beta hydrolase fold domain-containing protein [Dactylosporangium sp. AC04546]|uniref:alpha/beta hydrolase n=1 Tax=Dactylosporangium sp. AC04546 TaxID=2862460 RepID=UPI001EDDD3A7|nr:alpha/beta hydrolase fold domain-containing protein [Dactylosporangium sp. AC04546]WVK78362.1 alpha/beta hydrolase fold domain-containing protein [Dactylosporangium sp. AC04546]